MRYYFIIYCLERGDGIEPPHCTGMYTCYRNTSSAYGAKQRNQTSSFDLDGRCAIVTPISLILLRMRILT